MLCELDGHRLPLNIWDTAGQERFRTITRSVYRDPRAVLVVFDVTDRTSFADLPL